MLERCHPERAAALGKALQARLGSIESMPHPSVIGTLCDTPFMEPEHAAFMLNSERPECYRNKVKAEQEGQRNQLEALGGYCELLLFSPNGNTNDSISLDKLMPMDKEQIAALPHVSYFGEPGVIGWMDIDDLVGPGISTGTSASKQPQQEFAWIGHNSPQNSAGTVEFKYWAGETLGNNAKACDAQNKQKGALRHLTFADSTLQQAGSQFHLRETIPLYDLRFLFLRGP
jgi:hypothetical protein